MAGIAYLGMDLAWGPRARTGLALLEVEGRLVTSRTVVSDEEIHAFIDEHCSGDVVAAIDAPLIVTNETGRRPCEAEISQLFQAYHAGAHTSNLSKPWFQPQPRGAEIAQFRGWTLDPEIRPGEGVSCAIEVYPHPAMVSLFGLDRVIPYKNKRGRDFESLSFAFGELMDHMEAAIGGVLGLDRSQRWLELRGLAGSARRKFELGRIEDEVDAVFCAYLAWLWVNDPTSLRVYGDLASGYIVSPPPPTVPPRRGTTKGRVARVSERPVSLAAELRRANPRLSMQEADELAAVAAAYYGDRR